MSKFNSYGITNRLVKNNSIFLQMGIFDLNFSKQYRLHAFCKFTDLGTEGRKKLQISM